MLSLILLTLVHISLTSANTLPCNAPSDANTSHPAPFWCVLAVSVDMRSSCATQVTEEITVPWTTDQLVRIVPHQQNQQITSVATYATTAIPTALRPSDGTVPTGATRLESVIVSLEGRANTAVTVTTVPSQRPAVILIRYVVVPGVFAYTSCPKSSVVLPSLPSPTPTAATDVSHSFMLTRWALGGLSVPRVNLLAVAFRVPVAPDRGFLDAFAYLDHLSVTTNSTESQATVAFTGNSSLVHPADMLLYARVWRLSARLACPTERDCTSERELLREGRPRRAWRGIMIVVVSVVAIVILVAVAVLLWFRRLKYAEIHENEDDNQSVDQTQLPKSLHHFAYDTGDESSSQTWREWMNVISARSLTAVMPSRPPETGAP